MGGLVVFILIQDDDNKMIRNKNKLNMRKVFLFNFIFFALTFFSSALGQTITDESGPYKFEYVKGDPRNVRIYTLDNGLKVYLMVNNDQPKVQTAIAVRTGGKNDPSETTGLAHYLEHIMFKGTPLFGTMDYTSEAPLLDKIESLYETYRQTTDPALRKSIYHEIDSISYLASTYAVANEYDKLMSGIGSEGSNAFTSEDETVYIENIPSNEIDNWAAVQSERFKHMVIRGFHTELEAVYEEYNRSLTQDIRKVLEAMNSLLYPHHPYGTQTVIGTQDHLKNPSITNIKNYFKKYYVPNNVAICMCGNISYDNVMEIISKHFGDWEASDDLSPLLYTPESPLQGELSKEVIGHESDMAVVGWRFPGKSDRVASDYAKIISELLYNSKAGFFDIDLNQQQKLLNSAVYLDDMSDYQSLIALAYPKEGQSLDEAKQLMLDEVARLLRGEFSEGMLKSIINNMKLDEMKSMESNMDSALKLADSFINGTPWEDEVHRLSRLDKISRQDVIDYSRKYLSDHNYACVYKRQGEDPNEKKIDKPSISAIELNRDLQTSYVDSILKNPTDPITPEYVDFENDVKSYRLKNGNTMLYRKNEKNGLFTLIYLVEHGLKADKYLPYAMSYFDYLGTKKQSSEQLKTELYSLACDITFDTREDQTAIIISGLAENQLKAITLFEQWVKTAVVDQEVYNEYVGDVLRTREISKSEQNSCYQRLYHYCTYGPDNLYTHIPSESELRGISPSEMLEKVRSLSNYKQIILYYGPSTMKEITTLLNKHHKVSKNPIPATTDNHFTRQTVTEDEVFISHYDSKAINMSMFSNNGQAFDLTLVPKVSLFNQYFGSGMNTIVFQELRESRGLAYQASAHYRIGTRKTMPFTFETFIISQNDKMSDCIDVFKEIIEQMPVSEKAFNLAKKNLRKDIESSRYVGIRSLLYVYSMKKLGLDHDLNQDIYRDASKITLAGLRKFASENVSGRKYRYIILGDENDLDMDYLKKLGKVTILSNEEIFGY